MSNYYEPPTDRAWDAFCDEYDPEIHGTDMDAAFEEWVQDQEDARDAALIAQAEDDRDFAWEIERDYGDEY